MRRGRLAAAGRGLLRWAGLMGIVAACAVGVSFYGPRMLSSAVDPECPTGPDHRLDEYITTRDATSLIGLPEAEVSRKLGPPTSDKFEPEWDRSYWLRPQGFCIDGWYLVLDLDDHGVVVDARVIGD